MECSTMLFVYLFLLSFLRTSTSLDSVTPGQSVTDGQSLVSADGSFELGFFTPNNSRNRYLGIWYKKISVMTVVWVANREIPLINSSGVLSINDQGILVLQNSTEDIIWSSNTSRTVQNPVAQLLESGNLVVKDGNDNNFLWQSFDHPGDTLLPGMKLGRNLVTGLEWFLTSWKSTDDPSLGDFSCHIDPRGYPQLVIMKGSTIYYRLGSWNGLQFTGTPALKSNQVFSFEFVLSEAEVYYKYKLLNSSVISRLVVKESGLLQRSVWTDQTNIWSPFLSFKVDNCDEYAFCGTYASCNIENSPECECLQGFIPKYPRDWNDLEDWTNGCARRTKLDCENGDGFLKYTGVKLPDTSYSWFNKSTSLKECEAMCLKNCSCTAYANSDIRERGSGCVLWFGDLIDIREIINSGQDIYIKMAASELDYIKKKRQSRRKKRIGIIVCSTLILLTGIILGLFLYIRKKKLQQQELTKYEDRNDHADEGTEEDMELPIFDLATLANATNNFSSDNKIGEGGFGVVYKGMLLSGEEIAVKRLSKSSEQGPNEFKNEVKLIAKLQHRNLVKLLGFCIQGDEKLLVYEYMQNRSLDYFVFDQTRSKLLNWHMRFQIINGVARGLLYLHQDSRLRIIHRDLKAGNVLLDNEMNPKISDFGMAKTFRADQTVANTNRVVGTYGYMSPEYAIDGLFSIKSDVFSFGVIVLEMVSGKKNRGFFNPQHRLNLLGHAWRLWIEERPLELIDNFLLESCALSEVLRCIHVGLLCVQQLPEDRPNMSTVVLMLGSENPLPEPKQPGFYTERNPLEGESSLAKYGSCSVNEITTTLLEAR